MKQEKNKTNDKVSRSEALTMRMEPKLRYALELLTKKQRRSLTNVVERAIEKFLKDPYEGLATQAGEPELDDLWDVDETEKFIKLAIKQQNLLTFEENVLWKLIADNGHYWNYSVVPYRHFDFETEGFVTVQWNTQELVQMAWDRVKADWQQLKAIADGQESMDCLVTIINPRTIDGGIRYAEIPDTRKKASFESY